MDDHACIKWKESMERHLDSISAMEWGRRVFCHRGCADGLTRFKTWHTVIYFDHDDDQIHTPTPFTLNVLADSRESAMVAVVSRYGPEESPGVCGYRVAAFQTVEWKRVRLREWGSRALQYW